MDHDLFANDVFTMFNAHKELLASEFGHIPLPTVGEVKQWIEGKSFPPISDEKWAVTRDHQFKQLTSAIGAYVVDRKLADTLTFTTYKGLWAIKIKKPCVVCGKDTKSLLMFQNDTCNKARCQLVHMRNSM